MTTDLLRCPLCRARLCHPDATCPDPSCERSDIAVDVAVPGMARVLAITCPPEPAIPCECLTCISVQTRGGPALDVSDFERRPRHSEWTWGCPCERCQYVQVFMERSTDPDWLVVSTRLWFGIRARRASGFRSLNRVLDSYDIERTTTDAFTWWGFEFYDRSGWCACARCQRANAYGDRPLWTAADVARARIFEGAETCPCARCLPRVPCEIVTADGIIKAVASYVGPERMRGSHHDN